VEVGWDEGVVWIGAKEGGVKFGGVGSEFMGKSILLSTP
jgi:hypothetical protein